MSTHSLISYTTQPAPSLRAPSYASRPFESELTVAFNERLRRGTGNFVKHSKHGHARLNLIAQQEGVETPVYGISGLVKGIIELDDVKTEGVDSVQIKIEGYLKVHELGESGDSTTQLVLDTKLLWVKGPGSLECPKVIDFQLMLPTTFTTNDGVTYPLPPTFKVKLKGIPGFTAWIEYSVSALINRPSTVSSLVPLVNSKSLGLHIGTTVISTPFLYYPRSRPSAPLPRALEWTSTNGFCFLDEWSTYEIISEAKQSHLQDIVVKFYIPKSRTFYFAQRIPFYLTIESSPVSLAAFLPFAPTIGPISPKIATRLEVLRQTAVNVRFKNAARQRVSEDMWRVDCIGEGRFDNHLGNDKTTSVLSGEIGIFDMVQVCGFKAAGISVKDCIVLSMTPPDYQKSPFKDFRLLIPIRLTTNAWTADGTGVGARDAIRGHPCDSQEQEYTASSDENMHEA